LKRPADDMLPSFDDDDDEPLHFIMCCLCSAQMPRNDSAMCNTCLRNDVDITSGFPRHLSLAHCRDCGRYNSPPWVKAEFESRELLAVCLKKIKGLKKQVKLVDANFLYCEEHSKRLKVKLTVQKEIDNQAIVQHDFVVEFIIANSQCDDCKRNWTPHTWVASCQVRQKCNHRRSLYFLEQLIIKHDLMEKILKVKDAPEGFDFFFASKSHCNAFSQFTQAHFACQVKESKQLVTHDAKNNTHKFKYSHCVDLCTVCKDDLVYFPQKIRRNHGGIGSILLATKVNTAISLVDPTTIQGTEVPKQKYYEHPFYTICTRRHLTDFMVINVEKEQQINDGKQQKGHLKHFAPAQIELARMVDFGKNDERVIIKSHMGKHLQPGDEVLGYDLRTINTSGIDDVVIKDASNIQVILVRKKFRTTQKKRQERRKWKLRRMALQNDEGNVKNKENRRDEQDFADFQDDLEEDAELRRDVNIYRDPKRMQQEDTSMEDSDEDDESVPEIPLAEMLEGLDLNEDSEDDVDGNDAMEEEQTEKENLEDPMERAKAAERKAQLQKALKEQQAAILVEKRKALQAEELQKQEQRRQELQRRQLDEQDRLRKMEEEQYRIQQQQKELQQQQIEQTYLLQKQQMAPQPVFTSTTTDMEMEDIKRVQLLAQNTAMPDDDDFDDL